MKPTNQREARLWNYFNTKQDWFFPIREWPTWVQRIALKEYKGNRDRFAMYFFLVSNGLEPKKAIFWISSKDVNPKPLIMNGEQIYPAGWLERGDYDAKGHRHFAQLRKQAETDSLFDGKKLVFDMTKRRIIRK